MLDCQRHRFTLPADLHYLNASYMTPLLDSVEAAGAAGLAIRHDPTKLSPETFFSDANLVRQRFAELINAESPERIALVPAVSYGMAIVAKNVRPKAGQTIVVVGEQFPSNVYAWRELANETGATLVTVVAPDQQTGRAEAWNAALLDAIDERTALVAVPQTHWADGTLFDLVAIGARARDVGAAFVIDGTQSVGAFPFDIAKIRPDALICAGYKWLLGGYGMGVAYLGERFDDGSPLEENWINRAGSEHFGGLVRYRDDYQPGALRYDIGERSNPILLPMLAEGLKQLLDWTPAGIQKYCAPLTASITAQARELGFWSESAEWRGQHLFGLRAPEGLPLEAVQAALAERNVSVSVRGDSVRVAPHVYNDQADADALLAALERATASAGIKASAAV